MAIPWLIGGAVLWAGKAIYDSIEDDEREERARESRREQRRELEREAEQTRKSAAQRAEKDAVKVRQTEIKKFTEVKIKSLVSDYGINPQLVNQPEIVTSLMKQSNVSGQKEQLNNAFKKSGDQVNLQNKIDNHKHEVSEISDLLLQLRGL